MTSPDGDALIRRATIAAVAAVGVIAAVISYRHQYELAAGHGESPLTARLLPLSIDGLLLAATLAVLDASRRGQSALTAQATVTLGVAMTLWANIVHGLAYGPAGVVVSGWPPVALIAAVEVLARMLRQNPSKTAAPVAVPAVPGPYPEPGYTPQDADQATTEFATELAAGEVPSIRAIRSRLHVGQPKATELRVYLTPLAAPSRNGHKAP